MIKIASLAAGAALLATSAHAQIAISTAGIETPAGAARFERDVRIAARAMCSHVRGVQVVTCKQGVREEALELLPQAQRLAFLQSREVRSVEYAANRTNEG